MKFLCDVHISLKLVKHLQFFGFEAVHINQILEKSETKDSDICKYADQNNYVVITKDADFRNSFLLHQRPKKLIKINLGNISNTELLNIFSENMDSFSKLNKKDCFLIEIDTDDINLIEI
jgi:predicted nuclease of predicted toxin-antitoxin system